LLFGIIVGPVLGLIPEEIFMEISPVVSVTSIILITFEAGADTNLDNLLQIIRKTAGLAFVTFILIVVATGLIVPYIYPDFGIISSMILGTMLGGLSTVAVTGLLDQLRKIIKGMDRVRSILLLESTIVDPVRIMVAVSLINIHLRGDIMILESLRDVYVIFTIGSLIGFLIGLAWTLILHRLRGRQFNYLLTLAILFQVYFLAEALAGEGGGTMACFTFGLALANYRRFTERFGFRPRIDRKSLMEFNNEVLFIFKSYYFVYTGLIVTLDRRLIFIGSVLTILLILIRLIAGTAVGLALNFERIETVMTRLTYPLGTSALVFAQLPVLYDPEGEAFADPNIFSNMVFPVVLGSILFYSIIAPLIMKLQLKEDTKKDPDEKDKEEKE
jgi:NhaP-type Na+/H+ or K+/H+ antiporter